MTKSQRQYAMDAEVRAVEEGHHSWQADDILRYRVKSDTTPDQWYDVQVLVLLAMENMLHFVCKCISGRNREHLSVPCKHAALVGRRLEREHLATWHDADWWATEKLLDKLHADMTR